MLKYKKTYCFNKYIYLLCFVNCKITKYLLLILKLKIVKLFLFIIRILQVKKNCFFLIIYLNFFNSNFERMFTIIKIWLENVSKYQKENGIQII